MNEQHPDLARVIVSEAEIQNRVREIAAQIGSDLGMDAELTVIGILKGAFIFMADLTRQLRVPHIVDFMALSSYGQEVYSSGAVRLVMDLRQPIEGRHVLVVEDIVDRGHTLRYLLANLHGRSPASLRTCALLRKKGKAQDLPIDYLGFEIPDVWVVGYGLDYAEKHRTLPFIAELKPEAYGG